MLNLFPEASVYDEPLGIGSQSAVCGSDAAFICVPTSEGADGSCDTSIVEDVMSWLEAKVIIIRSTVPVGFTDSQTSKWGKRVVFQPEYYGETVAHPFADPHARNWLTFGGEREAVKLAIQVYQTVCNAQVKLVMTDARTAELAKYMENCYLAMKVTFCNEFYDIAQGLGVDYNEVREVWLEDPRIGRSHTFVYENNRGFAGKCLPKDLNAMVHQAKALGINADLLQAVRTRNQALVENNS